MTAYLYSSDYPIDVFFLSFFYLPTEETLVKQIDRVRIQVWLSVSERATKPRCNNKKLADDGGRAINKAKDTREAFYQLVIAPPPPTRASVWAMAKQRIK